MSVNKYKILLDNVNKSIDLPIEMKWDFGGKDGTIDKYQDQIVTEVLGGPNDFEIIRFSHNEHINNDGDIKTDINYNFNFYNNNPLNITIATILYWSPSYLSMFTKNEVYYFTKPFNKSFFKLDFYDNTSKTNQKNYFTIIIPTQQGFTETVDLSTLITNVEIKKPVFKLDFIGDKEGFFINWLRKRDYIDIDKFYVSCKFFNAKTGQYLRMMNTCQALLPSPLKFDPVQHYYYYVKLDYNNKTYEIYNQNNLTQRLGSEQSPINWYELVNG